MQYTLLFTPGLLFCITLSLFQMPASTLGRHGRKTAVLSLCFCLALITVPIVFMSYSKTGFDGVNVASIKRVYIAEIARHMQCFK